MAWLPADISPASNILLHRHQLSIPGLHSLGFLWMSALYPYSHLCDIFLPTTCSSSAKVFQTPQPFSSRYPPLWLTNTGVMNNTWTLTEFPPARAGSVGVSSQLSRDFSGDNVIQISPSMFGWNWLIYNKTRRQRERQRENQTLKMNAWNSYTH